MPIPQEKKFCGMGILPVLVIFATIMSVGLFTLNILHRCVAQRLWILFKI
ncbi:hypothetical protein QUB70_19795 [Microcoleus sp. A003_D6]